MSLLRHTQSGRADARFPAGLPAEVRLPAARYACELADLSRSGALLRGFFPSPPSGRVTVVLSSARGDLRVALRARVARIDRPGAATHLGVEFQQVSSDERKLIDRLLSRIVEGSGSGLLATLAPTATADQVRAVLARMPAAHRIGLAARAQARERRFLRQDPDPLVLEALARNPNGTVEEAVELARMPSLRPATVAVLGNDPRFWRHEELQLLLASHPRASLQTAEKAAGRLGPCARSRLLERPHLHPALRRKL